MSGYPYFELMITVQNNCFIKDYNFPCQIFGYPDDTVHIGETS